VTDDHHLVLQQVALAYGDRPVVSEIDVALPPGRITVIVGANACGKSTVLRAMSRLMQPASGRVVLDGRDIHQLPTREVARTLGLLPQSPVAPEGIVEADLVARGRHPHQRMLARWSRADDVAVAEALAATGVEALADRCVDTLSGGQRQRVWIAMALAQQTDILLLDEPTTFLDVTHQVEVLDLLTDLNRARGVTIAMVLHDLNLAARYADHLIALRGGAVVAAGPPSAVVTEELVRDVFDLESVVITDPVAGTPLVVPRGRLHAPAAVMA
jgi:iron complex transport system ATP-binding protein